ncbi:rod shape-determining protein MreC [Massilia violaceinigra]|uniref:Cell shape-determining protein MreC n=1 Tax=Massilia violaceinigra TaxID=2045208 RepID=A0ABY4AKA2_9BURK|nr:rod shape-determining protein MreC [Massilia violaceinigra]UOD33038.1 rod shape-determining protein MreC [Massilia violaceinigra]
MEYSPPPLFKQGAPARVKVTVFAFISIVLLMIDARVQMLSSVRQVAGTVLYPLQMAALMPRDALANMGGYFSSVSSLKQEVRDLKIEQVAVAEKLQQAQLQSAENAQLRKLMGAREHVPVKTMLGEILYDARDSSTRKVVLDRGSQHGAALGQPVIDNAGVVGQVTRVFPFTSEVTLLTDREQAIPVQVLRNGLRSVAYGRGQSGTLDLRFVAPNADIQVGDVLITSGLDGVYPAGLAVAKVSKVENSGAGAFGGVVCQPLAGIDRNRHLLILTTLPEVPQRPAEEPPVPARKNLQKMAPIKEGAVPIASAATATAAAAAPKTAAPPAAAGKAPATPVRAPAATAAPAAAAPAAPAPKDTNR